MAEPTKPATAPAAPEHKSGLEVPKPLPHSGATPTPEVETTIHRGDFGKSTTVVDKDGKPLHVKDIKVGSQELPTHDHRDQATATLPDGTLANKPGMSSH